MAAGGVAETDPDEEEQTSPPQAQPTPSLGADVPQNTPITMPGPETQATLPGASTGDANAVEDQANSKGKVPTYPGTPKYDTKKLANAQTTLDVLNAMRPASRNDYMDWWEKQHGAINDHYDKLQQQLGQRPDDDQPYSKKEKFAALLEFGLHLMKASAKPSVNQGANLTGTLSDEMDSMQAKHQAGITQQQSAYDQSSNAIEAARNKEQAGIGTPRAAWQQQESINKDRASELKDVAGAAKDAQSLMQGPKGERPVTFMEKDGQQYERDYNPIDGTYGPWHASMQANGRPLPAGDPTRGPRGGVARQSVYAESLAEFDKRNPLPTNATPQQKADHDLAALTYAKGGQQIDSKLYATSRQQATREIGNRQNYDPSDNNGLSYDDAIRERTAEILDQSERRSPALIRGPGQSNPLGSMRGEASPSAFGVPPASLFKGVGPGQAIKINGAYWTIGIDGQPRRVDTTLGP